MPHPSFLQSQPFIKIIESSKDSNGNVVLTDNVLSPNEFPFVSGVTIVQTGTDVDVQNGVNIELSLDMPYEEGIALLSGEYGGLIKNGNVLVVSLGYRDGSGMVTSSFSGIVTDGGSGLTLGPEGLSGSIRATCAATQTQYSETFTDKFFAMGPEQQLVYLAKKQGYSTVNVSNEASGTLDLVKPVKFNGQMSYVGALEKLLRHFGLVATAGPIAEGGASPVVPVDGELVLSVYSPGAETQSLLPVVKFGLRGDMSDGETWPILAWNPEVNAANFNVTQVSSGANASVVMSGIDKNGEILVCAVNPAATDTARTMKNRKSGPTGLSDMAGTQQVDVQVDGAGEVNASSALSSLTQEGTDGVNVAGMRMGLTSSENATVEGSVGLLKRMILPFITGTPVGLTTLGCPLVTCGTMIEIFGVGDYLSGNYQVKEVTHAWTPGSWETTLSAFAQSKAGSAGDAVKGVD